MLDGSTIGAGKPGRRSPSLSTASTADGDQGELHSSPSLPSLPPPKLSERATQLLKSPQATARESSPFGTASWGSPYPISDQNLRRQSFSSDLSDDSPVHQIGLDTRFLRPPPEDSQTSEPEDSRPTLSAAATILANRVRRKNTGIKEDWIRAHTAGDTNAEPRLWFSDGSDSEHSSLTGSDFAWVDETGLQTPRTIRPKQSIKEPRAKSSVETLKSNTVGGSTVQNLVNMESETEMTALSVAQPSKNSPHGSDAEPTQRGSDKHNTPSPADVALPTTPTKLKKNKPLPADPPVTPRIKKKVPWKGKNIVIQVPRDDERGLEGKAPNPLRPAEVQRMFDSWSELGYSVHGFDLLVEGYHPAGTDDSQSRTTWPLSEDVAIERRDGKYKVQLPDLNGMCIHSIILLLDLTSDQLGKIMFWNCRRRNSELSVLKSRRLQYLQLRLTHRGYRQGNTLRFLFRLHCRPPQLQVAMHSQGLLTSHSFSQVVYPLLKVRESLLGHRQCHLASDKLSSRHIRQLCCPLARHHCNCGPTSLQSIRLQW